MSRPEVIKNIVARATSDREFGQELAEFPQQTLERLGLSSEEISLVLAALEGDKEDDNNDLGPRSNPYLFGGI